MTTTEEKVTKRKRRENENRKQDCLLVTGEIKTETCNWTDSSGRQPPYLNTAGAGDSSFTAGVPTSHGFKRGNDGVLKYIINITTYFTPAYLNDSYRHTFIFE